MQADTKLTHPLETIAAFGKLKLDMPLTTSQVEPHPVDELDCIRPKLLPKSLSYAFHGDECLDHGCFVVFGCTGFRHGNGFV